MTEESHPFEGLPRTGSLLVVGPSGAGKTRLTARTLQDWIDTEGTEGVVVLEFGPAIERDGDLVGGHLDRFVDIPEDVWHGVLDAHAPRLESDGDPGARELARENARGAKRLFGELPDRPNAVFVNDATIPFQHESGDSDRLLEYANCAPFAMANAYEGDEIGGDDAISRRERSVLRRLRAWADRTIELE